MLSGCLLMLLAHCDYNGSAHQNEPDNEIRIRVDAGGFDRYETVVSFHLPVDLETGVYMLEDQQGKTILLQVDTDNLGWLILEELRAGETMVYTLIDLAENRDETFASRNRGADGLGVRMSEGDNTITFSSGSQPILSYFHRENEPRDGQGDYLRRAGYIHPLYSPSGTILTYHLNPDQQRHHYGIWSAWTNTEFEGRTPDFWNVMNKSGRVELESVVAEWEGPVHSGLRSRLRFIDLTADSPIAALNEQWDLRVYPTASNGNRPVHIFDLKVTQTANTDKPLVLPEHRYGGIGFRGHRDWDEADNVSVLTSDGLGRDGHATRPRWVHIGGYTGGALAGVAILCHPSNFRFPQPVRIHPEAPFFNYAPTQLGDMSIQPGAPYVSRYRYVTYDGKPDAETIERFWADYAYPPVVTVSGYE